MNNITVDTSRFNLKLERVKKAFDAQAKISLTKAAQKIYKETAENLRGPNYGVHTTSGGTQVPNRGPGTGKMPVPRVTGTLARSLKMEPLTPEIGYAIYNDPSIAQYAKWVHDGTKKMPARRYLWDVVTKNRSKILKEIDKELHTAIQSVGRA
jgi:HK97 gp10 family phage protein